MPRAKRKVRLTQYVTTYCSKPHRLKDGKPINHQCVVFPPRGLALERQGDHDAAIKALKAAVPLPVHRGVRS
jgi:hypothetical protein